MALPILPIILAVTALGSGIAQGISSARNAKAEAEALAVSTNAQIKERSRKAAKLMQEQKTSFLKSGVYFDSGSPVDIINETYDTMKQDVADMAKDSNTKINNLMRQGRTAFATSIIEGLVGGAMGYEGAGKLQDLFTSSGLGTKLAGGASTAKNNFMNWWQNLSGKYRGGFGSVSNNALNNNVTKIV